MSEHFILQTYEDCQDVTFPKIKDMIYLLLKGQVHVISEERNYKNVQREIKKTRKKRDK